MKEYVSRYAMSSGDPFAFFRLMFRTIRVALLDEGIDLDPVLHEAGVNVGEALYARVADPDTGRLLANLAKFWEAQRLGRLEVKSMEPLDVVVYDCFECQDCRISAGRRAPSTRASSRRSSPGTTTARRR